MKKRITICIITLVILTLLVFGILQIQQHIQLQEAISLEQERVENIRRAVFHIGGISTEYVNDDGFPSIEYTLETNLAIINLAGLEIVHGVTPEQTMAILIDRNHPQYPIVHLFIYGGGNVAFQTELMNLHYQQTGEVTSVLGLPIPVLQELIQLEAEQRQVQPLITSRG